MKPIGNKNLAYSIRAVLGLLVVVLALATLPPVTEVAQAQEVAAIEPRSIALTPADLPPDFTVSADKTCTATLSQAQYPALPGDVGVIYRVSMQRPFQLRYVTSGPVVVEQIVARIDQGIEPADAFSIIRDRLIEERGLTVVPEGPNDETTVSLRGTPRPAPAGSPAPALCSTQRPPSPPASVPVVGYVVGMRKNNFIIFTIWGGLASATRLSGLVDLANVTAGRYDSAAAQMQAAVPGGGSSQSPAT